MKKILTLLIGITFVFGLAGCDLIGGDDPIVDDILDCIENPEDPACDPGSILTDELIANWDGSMEHINLLMNTMDFESEMTQTMSFSMEMEDYYNGTTTVEMTSVDSYIFGTYTILHRQMTETISDDYTDLTISTQVIYEEVETGVHVYLYIAPIKAELQAQGLSEVVDGMNALGLSEDWVLFQFDDTLANVIELEVLKDMLVEVLFKEVGTTFFYDLQDEVELELGIDFELYGVDLGLFVDYLVNEDFASAEAMVNAIDFAGIFSEFDLNVVNQTAVDDITYDTPLIAAQFPSMVIADEIAYLQANGFLAWYETLTVDEEAWFMDNTLDDPGYQIFVHYDQGDLPHFIVMLFLNDPYNEEDLRDIPGFDFDTFKTNMDNLDYDAFMQESIDIESLLVAIYDGQTAFDAYVAGLATTAPQTAQVLAPFSDTVLYLEDFRVFVEDIQLGLDNMTMFEDYFTMEYYVNNGMAALDVWKNADNEFVTTVTMDNMGGLAVDLLPDIYNYLDSFNSFEMPYVQDLNCPTGEYCEPFSLDEVVEVMNLFGPMEMDIIYDPVDPDEVRFEMDMIPMLDAMAQDIGEHPFNVLEMSMTMSDTANITMPSAASNANDVAKDFAKFSLYIIAWDVMDDLEDEFLYGNDDLSDMVGNTYTITELEDMDIYISKAFDSDLSTVTIGGTVTEPTFAIELVWIDGTNVFTSSITKAELEPVIGNGSGAPDATEYATYLAKVDATNFNMTKLFLVYLLEEDNYTYIEDDYYYGEFDEYWAQSVYSDAVNVENAVLAYCNDNACADSEYFTYGQLQPYLSYSLDEGYYELYSTDIEIAEIYYGYVYVSLEAYGTGSYEFPTWISPSQADYYYVEIDWN